MGVYILISCLFLFRGILNLEKSIFSLKSTRSRETKVLNRRQIQRNKTAILMSPIWPVFIAMSLREIFGNLDLVTSKRDE